MNWRVKAVLEGILERFKTGDVPKAVAYSLFPIAAIPSSKWSFMNRFIMVLSGTADARGIKQWNSAGRKVIKGSHAIYILVPRIKKVEKQLEGVDYETRVIKGFMAQPVFRVEDTEGEPLDYQKENLLPSFPLIEKAREWGIKVKGMRFSSLVLGAYNHHSQEIVLATPAESVFFHELAHAAHARLGEDLNHYEQWHREIVAELSSQALCQLIGKKPLDTLGNSYLYIEKFARDAGLSPLMACLKVVEEVQKVLSLILDLKQVQKEQTHESTIDDEDDQTTDTEKEEKEDVEYTDTGKTHQNTQAL